MALRERARVVGSAAAASCSQFRKCAEIERRSCPGGAGSRLKGKLRRMFSLRLSSAGGLKSNATISARREQSRQPWSVSKIFPIVRLTSPVPAPNSSMRIAADSPPPRQRSLLLLPSPHKPNRAGARAITSASTHALPHVCAPTLPKSSFRSATSVSCARTRPRVARARGRRARTCACACPPRRRPHKWQAALPRTGRRILDSVRC